MKLGFNARVPFRDNSRARYLHRNVIIQHERNFRTCTFRTDIHICNRLSPYYLARALLSIPFLFVVSVRSLLLPNSRIRQVENFIKARSAIEISDSLKREKEKEGERTFGWLIPWRCNADNPALLISHSNLPGTCSVITSRRRITFLARISAK